MNRAQYTRLIGSALVTQGLCPVWIVRMTKTNFSESTHPQLRKSGLTGTAYIFQMIPEIARVFRMKESSLQHLSMSAVKDTAKTAADLKRSESPAAAGRVSAQLGVSKGAPSFMLLCPLGTVTISIRYGFTSIL